jgi:hypothetical protein
MNDHTEKPNPLRPWAITKSDLTGPNGLVARQVTEQLN